MSEGLFYFLSFLNNPCHTLSIRQIVIRNCRAECGNPGHDEGGSGGRRTSRTGRKNVETTRRSRVLDAPCQFQLELPYPTLHPYCLTHKIENPTENRAYNLI